MSRAALLAALLLGAAGCPGDDECTLGWHTVLGADQLDRSVLSAGGHSAGDVYLVGGGLGVAGAGALALHWDGERVRELPLDRSETLWWQWSAPGPATDVWMVGERGLVLRWDGAAFHEVASGVDATLFGVWGASSDDVWIVGGTPGAAAGDDDVVLRWDGDALTPTPGLPASGTTYFKVWGASANDVWISGEAGALWRYQGGEWDDHVGELGTTVSLLTVHGCSAGEVYAVGGQVIGRFDGAAWSPVDDVVVPAFVNGVSCGAAEVLVVGNGGLKLRLDKASGVWTDEQFEAPFDTDFHGAFAAPDGGLWATGGNFLSPASVGERVGVVGYRGCPVPAAEL